MLTLDVQAIKDFSVCELYYDYKYRENLPRPIYALELLSQRYSNTIKRVVAYFFYKKQGGVTPSYNALLSRWEKLWFPKDMTAYDISIEQHYASFPSSHMNMITYSNAAVAALSQFYEDFSEDSSTPLLIDEKFAVPITKDIRLEGTIDLLLRDEKNRHRIIKWVGGTTKTQLNDYILDLTAQRIAFDLRNKEKKQAEYGVYELLTTTPGYVRYDPTARDINSLVFWAKQIYNTETFVPRRGFTVYCKNCPFDGECSSWNGWLNGN